MAHRDPGKKPDQSQRREPAPPLVRNPDEDPVREASEESFPASDPPAWAGGHDEQPKPGPNKKSGRPPPSGRGFVNRVPK